MNMENIWMGVESLIDSYAHIKKSDEVLLVFTPDAYESAAYVSAGLEHRGINFQRLIMNPLADASFSDRLQAILPAVEDLSGRLVIMTFERDTMSHTSLFYEKMKRYPSNKVVALRAISASPELFSVGLRAAPVDLEKRNTFLIERILGECNLQITTPGGSELDIVLSPNKHRWISNRGRIKEGGTMILPAGEVATYPEKVNGIFVADFAYNVNTFHDEDVRLTKSPVILEIRDSVVQEFHTENKKLMSFLNEALKTDCSRRIGELGFGTNFSVQEAIAMNSHVNERCPGIHLGLGQHNQDPGVVQYQCMIHLDLIAKGGLVWSDGKFIVDLSNIPPSDNEHPNFTADEDVFSPAHIEDCCGVMQCAMSVAE